MSQKSPLKTSAVSVVGGRRRVAAPHTHSMAEPTCFLATLYGLLLSKATGWVQTVPMHCKSELHAIDLSLLSIHEYRIVCDSSYTPYTTNELVHAIKLLSTRMKNHDVDYLLQYFVSVKENRNKYNVMELNMNINNGLYMKKMQHLVKKYIDRMPDIAKWTNTILCISPPEALNEIGNMMKDAGWSELQECPSFRSDFRRQAWIIHTAYRSEYYLTPFPTTISEVLSNVRNTYIRSRNISRKQIRLPWIFVYNSANTDYDYMVKMAVLTSKNKTTLNPYCMYIGGPTKMLKWLYSFNVTVIRHRPQWRHKICKLASADNINQSHLYASCSAVTATWARIDIPNLRQLEEYDYVLYTDTDVIFQGEILLEELPFLPTAVGMAVETHPTFPLNAGVMFINMRYLRDTYNEFLAFIYSNKEGLFFPRYGPGDQGAYNMFYEGEIRRQGPLPEVYNAKPYKKVLSDTRILHFQGPKIHDYTLWLKDGWCRFGLLCKNILNYCKSVDKMHFIPKFGSKGCRIWKGRRVFEGSKGNDIFT